jgi:hypothetical protein
VQRLTISIYLVCPSARFETETTLGRFSVALGGKASKRQTIETLIRSLTSDRAASSPAAFLHGRDK